MSKGTSLYLPILPLSVLVISNFSACIHVKTHQGKCHQGDDFSSKCTKHVWRPDSVRIRETAQALPKRWGRIAWVEGGK